MDHCDSLGNVHMKPFQDNCLLTASSQAFAVAQSILEIFQVANGFGKHIEYLQPNQIKNVLFITTILEVLHTIGTLLVRVSVCLFVLRLVPPTHQEFYKYTYILIAFFAVISTATFMLILLACIPIQGTWDKEIKARCIARSTLEIIVKTQGGVAPPKIPPYLDNLMNASLMRRQLSRH